MGDQIIVEVPAGAVLHHDVDMVGILRDFVHVNDERAPAGVYVHLYSGLHELCTPR